MYFHFYITLLSYDILLYFITFQDERLGIAVLICRHKSLIDWNRVVGYVGEGTTIKDCQDRWEEKFS